MVDVAKSEAFRNFTILNNAFLILIKLDKSTVQSVQRKQIKLSFSDRWKITINLIGIESICFDWLF